MPMKRTEPTLQQWKDLFEAAGRIKQAKPWEYLYENNIVMIQMPKRTEPIFCSVLGADGEAFAVLVYPDRRSFAERNRLFSMQGLPFYVLACRQNCFSCNFGNRGDLSNEEYRIVKDLGLRFRGENQWIYFNTYKTGRAPWLPDSEEAGILIDALQNFFMAFRSYVTGKLKVDFKNGKILCRFYSEEKKLWFNAEVNMPAIPEPVFRHVVVTDELAMARLKAMKKTDCRMEADLLYLPVPIREKKGEVPFYPELCLIADRDSGTILDQCALDGEKAEEDVLLTMLDGYVRKAGRPCSIEVRDEAAQNLIEDFCEKCGIAVERSASLRVIDSFVDGFLNNCSGKL